MQSRRMSAAESVANILIGIVLAVLIQILTFPLFDIDITLSDNIYLSLIFTAVSLVRSYAIRRLFNMIDQ